MEQAKLFGRRLRSIRKALKITQEQIAEEAEINPKYLGELERGEKKPSFDVLVALSTALGVPLGAFFQFDREERDEKALRRKLDSILSDCSAQELNQIFRVVRAIKGP